MELMKHKLLSLTDKCPFSINESNSEAPSILDVGPGGKLGLSTLAEIMKLKEYEDRERSHEREKLSHLQNNSEVVYSSVRHSRGQL